MIFQKRRTVSFSFEIDKKPRKFLYALGKIEGFFYRQFQKRRERFRVFKKNEGDKIREYSISLQIIEGSVEILKLLFIVFLW